uniref:Reverse transcriptase domain-containing protein n=1 Tax=Tanacetum cinerariifolium TaxID=118510 RepID=A0A6L2N5J4_TANCI|nr:reverse transcriptase domain-containing protein [Tanacetum cinerariifolium]
MFKSIERLKGLGTEPNNDEECESVDSTKYQGMIGSLLYLMASRPDIMFSVYLCGRFQEAPKTSHLEAVKRIIRSIKSTTHLGLWNPKATGIETVVYADSDHTGDYVDWKSTSGICTFVGCCLTSWFYKKQTTLAISTIEAECVSAGKACQQASWMKQALIDYNVRLDDDRVMNPPTAHQERKTRKDSGTRRVQVVSDVQIIKTVNVKMRIEQYFLMADYSLWEVILNDDSPVPSQVIEGVVQPVASITAEQRLARRNELKAKLHQLDTFYNALNSNDQDSLNSAAGVVAKVSMNTSTFSISPDVAELKDMVKALLLDKKIQNQAPATVKAVKESCVTCGGAHSYHNCLATNGNVYRENIQELAYQALAYQAPAPQTQGVSKDNFSAYVKANDAVMRNMQTQGQNMQNQLTNLTELVTKFVITNSASTSSSGTLLSNTIANPRSGGNKPEATKDIVHPTNNESTEDVQPLVVRTQSPILTSEPINSPIIEPVISQVSALRHNLRPLIPYPSRMQEQKLCDKANNQREKFFQIFKDLNFNISFADTLILMPKFGPSIKSLLTNKDKLCELARTPLNEHYLAVLLKKLLGKLGDPDKFLIPCDFFRKAECLALADLGVSINLMPLFVLNKLSLPDLSPTFMTLELAGRSISCPVGVAEDVYVKVGTFHFSADFVVVDFDADPRVPQVLSRSFLKIERALIDVFEGELTLRVGKEAITFNLNQTSRYSANYSDMTAKRIDVIDMACEEYSQEVLDFSDVITSGKDDAFLALEDDPTSPKVDQSYLDSEGGILLLEAFLNDDPSLPPPNQGNYLPEVRNELKICEVKSDKSSIDEPQRLNSKIYLPTSNMHFWKRCIMAIFHDMIEKTMEVFMDDFSVFRNSFQSCLSHLEKMLKRCDASDFAIGAVLRQRQDKHFRPIHYASKTMTEAESNYTMVKDNKEKDKIRAKTGQNQEHTGSVEKSKVKPDKVKDQSKPRKHQMKENTTLGAKIAKPKVVLLQKNHKG